MRAADRPYSCFRKTEVLDLALLDQVLHCSSYIFDRHGRVDPVLIEQIDHIGLQALERGFGDRLDLFRPAVQSLPARASIWIEIEAELGDYDHLVTYRRKRLAQQLLVGEWAIDLSGIEKCDATFHGGP